MSYTFCLLALDTLGFTAVAYQCSLKKDGMSGAVVGFAIAALHGVGLFVHS